VPDLRSASHICCRHFSMLIHYNLTAAVWRLHTALYQMLPFASADRLFPALNKSSNLASLSLHNLEVCILSNGQALAMSYFQLLPKPRWFAVAGRVLGKLLYIPATLAVIQFAAFFFKVARLLPPPALV
jgi:hypothetical protein